MLKDMEENRIYLAEIPNRHVLILGKSGMGKTYFTLKAIEEEVKKGRRILLFDFSGSYTLDEIAKADFQARNEIEVLNLAEKLVLWETNKQNLALTFAGAILKSLHVDSYYQKKLLKEAIQRVQNHSETIGFEKIISCLEDMLTEDQDSDNKKNILHLLTRLEPYSELENLQFIPKEAVTEESKKMKVIQLSDFPEIQRKFLTTFLTEISWEEIRVKWRKQDIVVFDEFQFMSLKHGTGLSEMLREGRKFGLAVYLSTQFVGEYGKDELNTVFQCGNILFFRPTLQDFKKTANMVSTEKGKGWEVILKNLDIGEAVLLGNYRINGRQRIVDEPIVCKVQ